MAYDPFHSIQFDRLPFVEMLGNYHVNLDTAKVTYSVYPKALRTHFAHMLYQYLLQDQMKWDHPEAPLHDEGRLTIVHAKQVLMQECSEEMLQSEWWQAMLHIVADFVPCWSAEQLAGLLHNIETSSCAKHFSGSHRDFIALIKAVAGENSVRMVRYSKNLLEQMGNNVLDADLLKYILSAGMLGDLAEGNIQEAGLLWRKYGPFLPVKNAQSIPVRVLVARLSPGGQGNISSLHYLH